ncbi:MAG: DUF1653 domain-containing protein, partial [bacterium]
SDDNKTKVAFGRYRHYKGREYEVIGVSKDSETLKDLVIYKALYDSEEFGNNALWTRPVESFLEKVDLDGEEVPRFEYIG